MRVERVGWSDVCGGDVELDVVIKAVKLKFMTAYYLTKRKNVQDEEERGEN